MSGSEWDDLPPSFDEYNNRDNQQWANAPPPPPPPGPYVFGPPPIATPQTHYCGRKLFAFIGVFVFSVLALQFFLSPSCHDSPRGSALLVYKFRQGKREETFRETLESFCNSKGSYLGGKVVSIGDEEHYDFIQTVRIQFIITSMPYYFKT